MLHMEHMLYVLHMLHTLHMLHMLHTLHMLHVLFKPSQPSGRRRAFPVASEASDGKCVARTVLASRAKRATKKTGPQGALLLSATKKTGPQGALLLSIFHSDRKCDSYPRRRK